MAQVTDYNIGANPSGFDMRTEINNMVGAINTDNSGTSEPLSPFAFMKWIDTSNATYYYIKERNHTNDEWVSLWRYTVATKVIEPLSGGNPVTFDLANAIHIATTKATPVDADELALSDSEATFGLKNLTWANLKATLATYFNTLYVALTGNQTIAGIKTFSSSPIIPNATTTTQAIAFGQAVNLTDAQTVAGIKTFSSSPIVPTPTTSTQIASKGYVDSLVPSNIEKITQGTVVNSTSGAAIDFTSIPSWAKKITVMFNGVSKSGTSSPLLQIGDSGGIETTGYLSSSTQTGSSTSTLTATSGICLNAGGASNVFHGAVSFLLLNSSSNIWVATGVLSFSDVAFNLYTAGSKTLSSTLDRLRITTVNGTDTFDAGQINIMYEG